MLCMNKIEYDVYVVYKWNVIWRVRYWRPRLRDLSSYETSESGIFQKFVGRNTYNSQKKTKKAKGAIKYFLL